MGNRLPLLKRKLKSTDCEISVETPSSSPLTPYLLVDDPEDDRYVDPDFLIEASERFSEDDTVQGALVGAVEDLSRQLAAMNMNNDYKPHILVESVWTYGLEGNANWLTGTT